jgi:hypothetical protein
MKRTILKLLCVALAISTITAAPNASAGTRLKCLSFGAQIHCVATTEAVGPSSPGAKAGTEYVNDTLSCGPRNKPLSLAPGAAAPGCPGILRMCALKPGQRADPNTQIMIYDIYDTTTREIIRADIDCDAPTDAQPGIAAIKAEATKRAPKPRTTTRGTRYLINAAIVFYITPPKGLSQLTDLTIGPFTLRGHKLTIRLHLTQSTWTWGDDTTDTYRETNGDNPVGKHYTDDTPCESNTKCSHYIAHPYTKPGTYTIHAQTHWTGTYTLDRSTKQIPIPGDISTTDPTGRTITTHEVHAVLITPP